MKNTVNFNKRELFNFKAENGGAYNYDPICGIHIFIPESKEYIALKIEKTQEDCKEKKCEEKVIYEKIESLVVCTEIRRVALYIQVNTGEEDDETEGEEGSALEVIFSKGRLKLEYELKRVSHYYWQEGHRPAMEPDFELELP